MFDPGLPEITSAFSQITDHCLGAVINAQITIEQRHDNIVLLMLVPARAILGLHKVPSCDPRPFILYQHGANRGRALLALPHAAPFSLANSVLQSQQRQCKAGQDAPAWLYCRQHKGRANATGHSDHRRAVLAIALMIVNFGNRYTVLANLIQHLKDEVLCDNVLPNDANRFLRQISRLRNRLRLIGIIQSCAAIAFILALGAMIAAYFDEPVMASALFLTSIMLLMGSMLLFIREIQIANTAPDEHLSDLESHQESEQYLKPKRRRPPAAKTTKDRKS